MQQCASLVLPKCMMVMLRTQDQSECCKKRRLRTGSYHVDQIRSIEPYNIDFSYIIDADGPAKRTPLQSWILIREALKQ